MSNIQASFRTQLNTPGHNRISHIHFVGIGGVGMCGIAEILLTEGYHISGSDQAENANTKRLQTLGATIHIGHRAENIANADALVVSTAIQANNAELVAAKEKHLPIVQRAEMLAELMRSRFGIAIAGTHGKTTTTSLMACIMAEAGLDPTYVIGGKLNSSGSNARLGHSQYLVTEADESDASFLRLLPMMSVITNIDEDHMDTYHGSVTELHNAFIEFTRHLPFYGLAVMCYEDAGIKAILSKISRPYLTYGFDEKADVRAVDIHQTGTQTHFTVKRHKNYGDLEISLNLPGDHNVLNALSTITIATELGIEDYHIQNALKKFSGVGRRFQILGDYPVQNGTATIIDDYGHHPRELAAIIQAARKSWPERRLVMTFQPHRFTRTRDLMDEFAEVLNEPDLLVLLDVYSAGEQPIDGADSKTMARLIRQRGKIDPIYLSDKQKLHETLQNILRDGDIALMAGAGDISSLAHKLVD